MNILVLADSYYPIKNANSICIGNVIRIWKENYGDKITVICFGNQDNKLRLSAEDVYVLNHEPRKKWVDCVTLSDKFTYMRHRIVSLFSFPRIDRKMVKQYLDAIELLSASFPVDCILSICNPPESVEAGFQYSERHLNIPWIIYDIDTVSNRSLGKTDSFFGPILMRKAYSWEIRMFSKANHIVHLKQHVEHFQSIAYTTFVEKTDYIDLPLLMDYRKSQKSMHKSAKGLKTLLYAGSFYKTLREPWDMIKIVCNRESAVKLETSVYTEHAYVEKLKERYADEPGLKLSEYVPEEIIMQKMQEADFLLSIGNATTVMFPSKIVSYVSTGKPIIHLFSSDLDPVPTYLEPYPEKLLLDMRRPVQELIEVFNEFVAGQHHSISQNTIRTLYQGNLPECSAKIIRDAICRAHEQIEGN